MNPSAPASTRSLGVDLPPPSPHADILAAHARFEPELRARAEAWRARIEALLRAATGLKLHSVTVRVKSGASLAGKLARPDRSYRDLWDVTDLVGVRVITYFHDDVEAVGRAIEASLPVTLEDSTDKRRRDDAATFGYRSLHYVCALGAADDVLPARGRFEIQVRTVLEHAWAEIEHDLGYKAEGGVPTATQRRLHRLAGLLELVDAEFVAVRDELRSYAQALPARIADNDDAVSLDALSLPALLACPEVEGADEAVGATVGVEVGEEIFFPDYLVRMLAAARLRTVAEVRRAMVEHAARVVAISGPYFAFGARAWGLEPTSAGRLLRGYSLFFLAHVTLLQSVSLRLHKVEQLAALYRELDYPDDPRAAMRVASSVVEAIERALDGR